MNERTIVMSVKDITQHSFFIFEQSTMPNAHQTRRNLQDRVVLVLDPWSFYLISNGITYTILLTFITIGRIKKVIFSLMFVHKRTFIHPWPNLFPLLRNMDTRA